MFVIARVVHHIVVEESKLISTIKKRNLKEHFYLLDYSSEAVELHCSMIDYDVQGHSNFVDSLREVQLLFN